MPVRSLFLVTLVVDDYDRAKTFYCDNLGFDCIEDTSLADGKRWLVVKPKGVEGGGFAACSGRRRQAEGGNR